MFGKVRLVKGLAGAIVALCSVQAAQAETIPVEGVYAARVDLPVDMQIILIERFRGNLGQDLELALTERLGNVYIRGEPYFDLVTPNILRGVEVQVEGNDGTISTWPLTPDAELRGTVRSEVIEREVRPKIERECAKRDAEDKCVERREVRIECRELSVRVDTRLLLTGANGEQLYSFNEPRTAADRFCADESGVPSSLEMENELIGALADEIRRDLAPVQSSRGIRVMESRKNLRKEDRGAFRDAVKLTDDSVDTACDGFLALKATNSEHVSVLFNIGLCHESGGELEAALDYYARALAVDPGRDYPTDGIRRLRSRMRAEEDLAARAAL